MIQMHIFIYLFLTILKNNFYLYFFKIYIKIELQNLNKYLKVDVEFII